MTAYPKRLIEVDLPIKRISAHARREKSIRHGHISTLHIWWARRPLAACRAVICAALWPDPADEHCPQAFRQAAARLITEFARKIDRDLDLLENSSEEGKARWAVLAKPEYPLDPTDEAHQNVLRFALLDFIADFANWDNSTVPLYLETSRALTQTAHEALGGAPGTRPLVVDPFAGGGSIPLEALRVGADAFASDLNPVAVLLNKVVLEYIPKYGTRLVDEVRRWGKWVKVEAEKELAEFYPRDPDGATPIAYLWARTIHCEGPGCGAEVPLMRSLWLANKGSRSVALRIIPRPRAKRVEFEVVENAKAKDVAEGTVRRGSATCPLCGYTTPVASVRRQLKERRGGAADARLFCVVTTRPAEQGQFYRLPMQADLDAVAKAAEELKRKQAESNGALSLVPDEAISPNELRRISVPIYGMTSWGDLFTPRQALALATLTRLVRQVGLTNGLNVESHVPELGDAVQACLTLNFGRVADLSNSLCGWKLDVQCPTHLFARQAIGMVWDFSESVCLSESSGSWFVMSERLSDVLTGLGSDWAVGHTNQSSATSHPLPDDSASAIVKDPPYYDAVPYAYLSDFFYVWMRRMLADTHPGLFRDPGVPKDAEIVVDRPHQLSQSTKDIAFYERELGKAFVECRRVLRPDGVGTIVFASKTTASWEAIHKAVVDAGWTITGSWPIDTEMETRVAAQGQARLASSVHIVCRPREAPDGSVPSDSVGDWRDVLAELPKRIGEWMPRLRDENVVGADAIFACLGPALEIFSRYARVETPGGEVIPLGDVKDENGDVVKRGYLSHVWAAVAKEALKMVFEGADATGFEEDARLTAMWLWTLSTGGDNGSESPGEPDDEGEDAEASGKPAKMSGFVLEYDAARKIAQGLGAHLEQLTTVVEVKGDKARLLPVGERTRFLFGKDGAGPSAKRTKKKKAQLGLFDTLDEIEQQDGGWGDTSVLAVGTSVLDRIHQCMILFATGRSEAIKRFLVEDGIGRDQHFWRLAQALSALYPGGSDEKRWVDGVLARKKGLGF